MNDQEPVSYSGPDAAPPSVLPEIEAIRTPRGMQITRRPGDLMTMGILSGMGGIFSLIGGALLFATLAGGSVGVGTVVGGIFLVAGLIMLGRGGVELYHRSTLGDAQVDIPNLPLRLGESGLVHFTQRRTHRAEVRAVTAELECREWVRYRQGTDTRTDTHQLWSAVLPAQPNDPIGDSAELAGAWTLTIPHDLPPSFDGRDNEIQWILTIRVDVARRPDVVLKFTLPVAPEVLRDLR